MDRSMKKKADKLKSPVVGEVPWLVYTHGSNRSKQIQTFCNIFSNELYIKSIPELRGKTIRACCQGWLILRDFSKKNLFSMKNIITLEYFLLPELPISEDEELLSCCVITSNSPPNNPNGYVLFLFFKTRVFSCCPSIDCTCSWVSQSIELDGNNAEIKLVAALNGIMYGMAGIRNPIDYGGIMDYMVSMEIAIADDGSGFYSLALKPLQGLKSPKCDHGSYHPKHYLVESCSLIYCVGVFQRKAWDTRISEVKVWELDTVESKWVETKCLGGRSLFVGDDCCTWCWGTSTSTGVRENSVYFLSPIDDRFFYVYRLDDDTLTMHSTCAALSTPFSTPIWVNMMPPQQNYNYNYSDRLVAIKDIEGQELIDTILTDSTKPSKERNNMFVELPIDMIHLVSKYMHLFDYWNFQASCKTFHSTLPKWSVDTNSKLPLFIWFKSSRGLCQVMGPSREDSHSMILDLSPDPFIIDFSKDGWLVLTIEKTQSIKFCNPLTRVKGDYPPNEKVSLWDVRSIGFSTIPISLDCMTVQFVYDDYLVIYYHRYGDERWTRVDVDNDDNEFSVGTSSPVYFNGAFYVLDRKFGHLGAFELVDGGGSWNVYHRPSIPFAHFHSSHLVECGGKLLAVFIGYMGWRIRVFEFNHFKKQWIDVQNLGNHSLFINRSSWISKPILEVGMRNKICVSRLKGNGIISYSLETSTYHVYRSEDFMKNFCNTTEPLNTCWL